MTEIEAMGKYVLHIAVLGVSAAVGTLVEYNTARKNEEISFDGLDAVISLFVRAFTGFVFGLVANFVLGADSPVFLPIAVGGFLGLKGLQWLQRRGEKHLGGE